MRILMIAGVPGKAEAGVAGIVYNLARELGDLGHSVKPLFFEDLLPRSRGRIASARSSLRKESLNMCGRYEPNTTSSISMRLSVFGMARKDDTTNRRWVLRT